MAVRIINNGREVKLTQKNATAPLRPSFKTPRLQLEVGHRRGPMPQVRLSIRGKVDVAQVYEDMSTVQEHFGLNRSESVRLAFHLTANAIRENTARVKV